MTNRCLLGSCAISMLATTILFPAVAVAQVADPPAAMTLESVPGVPISLVKELAAYASTRFARRESWHPVRREMLISTRFGDTEQIHLVRSPGGMRQQLTFPPDRAQIASFEPARGDYFLFFKDVGGNERYQMYRQDVQSGSVTMLTDGTSRNAAGTWSPDGRLFAYRSNSRTGRHMDIHVMDPLRPGSSRLAVELTPGIWRVTDWSPNGRQLLLIEMVSDVDTRLWLADAQTGAKTRIATPGDSAVLYEYALFSRDGASIFALSDCGAGLQHLTLIDLATVEHRDITPNLRWDVEQFDISPDGNQVALTANEAGVSKLYLYDVRRSRLTVQGGIPVGIVRDLEWHSGGRELGFTLESSSIPGDVYSFDPVRGVLTRWTNSETGGLNLNELPAPELVTWTGSDGVEISGLLYRPPQSFAGRRPVMIRIHGGPLAQSRPQFLGRLNYYVNAMGIALLFPNVRGSSGYGRAFQNLDDGTGREGAVRDIGSLLDWIGQQPGLDADRVLVTGTSYGGLLSLAVAASYADHVACASSTVGISDLVGFVEHAPDDERESRRAEYGDERAPATRAFLQQFSPLSRAAQIRRPLLVVAGANDARVPVSDSRRIAAAVRGAGTEVWYLEAANEGHGYERRENADFLFYIMTIFTRRCLLP